MRVRLERRAEDEHVVTLGARVVFTAAQVRLRYATRTGALLRVDDAVAGAFDGGHTAIDLPTTAGAHDLTLTVERRALPISGLPPGDGVRWRTMLARAVQTPALVLRRRAEPERVRCAARGRSRRRAAGRPRPPRRRLALDLCRDARQGAADLCDRVAPARARRPLRLRAEPAAALRLGRGRRPGSAGPRPRAHRFRLGRERRLDVGRARPARAVG